MKNQIKVLVVEDHPIAQRIAVIVLNTLACEVDIAKNGIEALELFDKNHYDLIFMDIGLPDMSGLVVTANIRTKENKLNSVPVVGLTAHSNEEIRLEAIKVGMNDFLAKPLTKENCSTILNKFVYKK